MQVPNACYAQCLGYPTVGPWFCESEGDGGGDTGRGGGDTGDVWEVDGDGDGDEVSEGTDPSNTDSDGDGLSDGAEVILFDTDPTNADTDGDGMSDAENIGALLATPPPASTCAADLDSDGAVSVQDILMMLGQFGNICN